MSNHAPESRRAPDAPIAVFDSGVGGISVLYRAKKLLPRENFIYYADELHFPYGDRPLAEVKADVMAIAAELAAEHIKMLVVACNTATAAAIEELRATYDFPVLGIEPALKPAIEREDAGRIAIVATKLTLGEQKFQRLLAHYGGTGDIITIPAVGFADLVEAGHYDDDEGRAYLKQLFAGVEADTIVLGCTHYVFALPLLRELYPDATIIDGGEGLARNVRRTLTEADLLNANGSGSITVCSGATDFQRRFDVFFRDIGATLEDYGHKME